jgi:hypothetical protein
MLTVILLSSGEWDPSLSNNSIMLTLCVEMTSVRFLLSLRLHRKECGPTLRRHIDSDMILLYVTSAMHALLKTMKFDLKVSHSCCITLFERKYTGSPMHYNLKPIM